MTTRWRTSGVVFVLALFFFCSPVGAAGAPIRLAYSAAAAAFMPVWIAQDEGYFQRHGLETQTIYISGGAIVIQALLAGDLQFAFAGPSGTIRASLKGADLKLIAHILNAMDFHLVSRPEVRSIKQLKGRKVGVTRLGGDTDLALEMALGKLGLQRGRDVAVVQTGGMPQMMSALQAGAIDAGVITSILGLTAVKSGFRRLLDFGDLNVPYPFGSLIARQSYLASHRDLTLRFLRAFIEAIRRARHDRETALKMLVKYMKVQDPEILDAIYNLYRNRYREKISVDLEGVRNILRFVEPQGAGEAKPQDFVDNSFVEQLEREGFFQKLAR